MKVLHIFDHSAPLQSGYAFRSLAILREQRKFGWQTCHVTSAKHGDTEVDSEQVGDFCFYRTSRSRGVSALPLIRDLDVMRTLRNRITQVLEFERPDVLHAHSPLLNAFPAIGAAKEAGIPVVYEMRSLWEDSAVEKGKIKSGSARYRITQHAETLALTRADHIIAISQGLVKNIVARGIDESRVTLVPNGVDIERFPLVRAKDESILDRFGIRNCQIVGYAGSLHPYEGLSDLIRAVNHLRTQLPSLRCLIVGDGADRTHLQELTESLGLADRIIFAGQVPHTQISDFLSVMDALVYPRLPSKLTETVTPLKPLEAMAQGIPVIASDIGGHRELIDPERTGFLFRAGDSENLARQISALCTGKSCTDQIVKSARKFVESERSWRSTVAASRRAYLKAGVPERILDQRGECVY